MPAGAADLPYQQPIAPIQTYDWSGFYVGGQLGYAFGHADHSFGGNAFAPGDSQPDGLVGGAHLGYNVHFNPVVVGIEADIEGASIDGLYQSFAGPTGSGAVDVGTQGSVRARIGMAFDRFLPYATAGVAIASVDYSGGPAFGPCCGYSETRTGWTAGVGLDYGINDFISTGLEYRYTSLGEAEGVLDPSFPGNTMNVDLGYHAIRGRVSLSFGQLFR